MIPLTGNLTSFNFRIHKEQLRFNIHPDHQLYRLQMFRDIRQELKLQPLIFFFLSKFNINLCVSVCYFYKHPIFFVYENCPYLKSSEIVKALNNFFFLLEHSFVICNNHSMFWQKSLQINIFLTHNNDQMS